MGSLNAEFLSDDEIEKLGFASCGNDVKIHKSCVIVNSQNIVIGNHVRIDAFTLISASKSLKIGNHVHISSQCLITGNEDIIISNFSGLSSGVKLFASSDDYSGETLTNPTISDEFKNVKSKPVFIGEHVIIGANSVILPGVVLNTGVAIGACSFVNCSLDAWNIYAGSPIMKIKARSQNLLEIEARLLRYSE